MRCRLDGWEASEWCVTCGVLRCVWMDSRRRRKSVMEMRNMSTGCGSGVVVFFCYACNVRIKSSTEQGLCGLHLSDALFEGLLVGESRVRMGKEG